LIFRCKIKNETPDIHKYLLLIKNAKLVENKIAKKVKKLRILQEKMKQDNVTTFDAI